MRFLSDQGYKKVHPSLTSSSPPSPIIVIPSSPLQPSDSLSSRAALLLVAAAAAAAAVSQERGGRSYYLYLEGPPHTVHGSMGKGDKYVRNAGSFLPKFDPKLYSDRWCKEAHLSLPLPLSPTLQTSDIVTSLLSVSPFPLLLLPFLPLLSFLLCDVGCAFLY